MAHKRREELAEAARAQPPGQQLRQEHGRGAGEGDGAPYPERRVSEEHSREAQDERAQRRVVDVPPVEVFAAGDVVQLVAVKAAAADDGELEDELERRRGEQERGAAPRDGAGARRLDRRRARSHRAGLRRQAADLGFVQRPPSILVWTATTTTT
jgi:hypothetical protein